MALFELACIVKTHGLKGDLRAKLYVVADQIRSSLEGVFLVKQGIERQPVPFRLGKHHFRGRWWHLSLEGIDDRETAKCWVGSLIAVPTEHMAALPAGEYYWQDLIGLRVKTDRGEDLGRIVSVLPTGSNDVFVCHGERGEILIPALEEVVREIDITEKRMTVELLAGL